MTTKFPPVQIKVDGEDTTLYVQAAWSHPTVTGSSISYGYNERMYLSTSEYNDTSLYFKPNLVGGSLEYDVDVSQVGCGCISALYTVLMPGKDNNEDPFQYCDGNQVGGYWCPEFDIQEANKYAFHTTLHSCDTPTDGVYNKCDKSGQCT